VLSVQSAFGNPIHPLEHIAFAQVDRQHEFGCRAGASVKARLVSVGLLLLVTSKGLNQRDRADADSEFKGPLYAVSHAT
jgi:hypothetical protein